MSEFYGPASVPASRRAVYLKNYRRLTGGGRGHLFLIAGDQKVEHLNADFFGPGISPEDNDPEHLFKIAAASGTGVLATHLGLISRYGHHYRNLPYIVKINGKTNLGPNEDKDSSRPWWSVDEVVKFRKDSGLDIVAIGYTLYLGGVFEAKMLAAAAAAIQAAHQAGLAAVLWIYPRGRGINEENIATIAGAAGVAAALDADFVKLKYPYGAKNKRATARAYRQVTAAAGRTRVICVGGPQRPITSLLSDLAEQIETAGTAGLAMGRNLHQRPLAEASRLTAALSAIIFEKKNAKEALSIYQHPKKSAAKRTSKFLGIF